MKSLLISFGITVVLLAANSSAQHELRKEVVYLGLKERAQNNLNESINYCVNMFGSPNLFEDLNSNCNDLYYYINGCFSKCVYERFRLTKGKRFNANMVRFMFKPDYVGFMGKMLPACWNKYVSADPSDNLCLQWHHFANCAISQKYIKYLATPEGYSDGQLTSFAISNLGVQGYILDEFPFSS